MQAKKAKLKTPPTPPGNGNGTPACIAFNLCQPRFEGIENSIGRVEQLVRTLCRDAGLDPDAVAGH